MRPLKILIAAGGTGGHIYPALAMAEAFQRQGEVDIAFVGTAKGLENKLVPPKGFRVHHLPIGRLNSNVAKKERLFTVLLLPWALLKSFLLLRQVKPDFVLGVGGHASGPLLLAASLSGYKSAIWEPNAIPGMANRWLSRFVDDCWVVFDEAARFLKNKHSHKAGMPVRQEIEAVKNVNAVDGKFRVLVFGGSQGARGLNTAIVELLREGGEWLKDIHFVHQTGHGDYIRVYQAYGPVLARDAVDVREYLHDMGDQYARADLVICRSGTGTLSELAACGKASILIPLPTAADDHQRRNAESLVNKDAAIMILQKDLTPQRLRHEIERLKSDSATRHRMEEKIRAFHQPQAAEKLVKEFVERIEDATR